MHENQRMMQENLLDFLVVDQKHEKFLPFESRFLWKREDLRVWREIVNV